MQLEAVHTSFWDTAGQLPNPSVSINGKWSVAQNVQHITIGLTRIAAYLGLPKSTIEAKFGLSGRASKSLETMTKVFRNAFENGIQSTDSYLPEENPQTNIAILIIQGKDQLKSAIENLQRWSEDDLDQYHCPHPFLGKITVREILYFMVFHLQHHHETIKKMRPIT